MPGPQGLMSFPGIQAVIQGDFTLSHGIDPSWATLTLTPQDEVILENGTLTLTFGDGFRLEFPDCRVKSPAIQRNQSGRVVVIGIEDRRWKWQFGEIYGRYNIKRADGTIDTVRSIEKTPQELATLLLRAMNEEGFDVSALPNTLRPTREWDGNVPAQELAQLCDELGCRVVLTIENVVKLVRLGEGANLPENPLRRYGNRGIQRGGLPDSLKVVCAPTLFETKLLLEPVGLDNDGRWKPIDELSYTPDEGWGPENPDIFDGVENLADRRLALQTVFRCYRIKSQADGTMAPVGFPSSVPVTSIAQFLPIRAQTLRHQLVQQRDDQDVQTEDLIPAYIEGRFQLRNFTYGLSENFADIQVGATTDGNGNTYIGARYVGGFSIDEQRGIVTLSDWCVLENDDGENEGAELYLTCSYSVTNDEKLPYRYGYEKSIGDDLGTGPKVIPAPDIALKCIATYDTDGRKVKVLSENRAKVDQWSRELIEQAELEYQAPYTEQMEYAGWLEIDVDGRIQQVGWSFGPGGAYTKASSNTEYDPIVPKFQERREQQRVRALQGSVYRAPVIVGGS